MLGWESSHPDSLIWFDKLQSEYEMNNVCLDARCFVIGYMILDYVKLDMYGCFPIRCVYSLFSSLMVWFEFGVS